ERGAFAWRSWLEEPQILVDASMAERFGQALASAGLDPQALLMAARGTFIDSVHHSQWLVLGVMALGFVILHRMPPIRRRGTTVGQPVPGADPAGQGRKEGGA